MTYSREEYIIISEIYGNIRIGMFLLMSCVDKYKYIYTYIEIYLTKYSFAADVSLSGHIDILINNV